MRTNSRRRCCAFHADRMANVWMHNGFLQVEEREDVEVARQLRHDPGVAGGLAGRGAASQHAEDALSLADRLDPEGRWKKARRRSTTGTAVAADAEGGQPSPAMIEALSDDLNTPQTIAVAARPAQRGGVRRRTGSRRVCRLASAARLPLRERCGMEGTQAAGERRRCEADRPPDCGPHRRARAKGLQGVRSHPRRTRRDGRCHQGRQGCRRQAVTTGRSRDDKPDTPFPKHWRYYIFIKWALIVAAVVLA